MANPNPKLIAAMRSTATKLAAGAAYQWGHMGRCNCGNLAQELTELSPAEIHAYALRARSGDWAEQIAEFCPASQLPMDLLVSTMLDAGLSRKDLEQLERLSNPEVLKRLHKTHLQHNRRADVISYLQAWADMLAEEQMLNPSNVYVQPEGVFA